MALSNTKNENDNRPTVTWDIRRAEYSNGAALFALKVNDRDIRAFATYDRAATYLRSFVDICPDIRWIPARFAARLDIPLYRA